MAKFVEPKERYLSEEFLCLGYPEKPTTWATYVSESDVVYRYSIRRDKEKSRTSLRDALVYLSLNPLAVCYEEPGPSFPHLFSTKRCLIFYHKMNLNNISISRIPTFPTRDEIPRLSLQISRPPVPILKTLLVWHYDKPALRPRTTTSTIVPGKDEAKTVWGNIYRSQSDSDLFLAARTSGSTTAMISSFLSSSNSGDIMIK